MKIEIIHHLLSSTRETIRKQESMSGIIMPASNAGKFESLFSPTKRHKEKHSSQLSKSRGKHISFAGYEVIIHKLPFKSLGSAGN